MVAWNGAAGRRVVITGGTSGIGLAAAEALAGLGARVTIVARSEERAAGALEQIRSTAEGADVETAFADLTHLASVRGLAAELSGRYPVIDVLVNNAGAMFRTRTLTADGFETTWALNHLAPFLLTNLLLDGLKQHPPARVITTASDAHRRESLPFDDLNAERSYRAFGRYGQTKLANIAFTVELGRRLAGSGVAAYCFHPGLVATGFNRNNARRDRLAMSLIKPFCRTPAQGAATLVWLADTDEVPGDSGGYFTDRHQILPNAQGQDPALARRLWDISAQQVALQPGP